MRWAALFADLEGQLASVDQLALEAEVADRTRLEQSGLRLGDRLRGQHGRTLRVRSAAGRDFEGRLVHVGAEWLVLESGVASMLIPFAAAAGIQGMDRATSTQQTVSTRRLGLASALRALSRDRTPVSVYLRDQTRESALHGTIDRTGKDFVEIALVPVGEQRHHRHVTTVLAVPLQTVAAVVSDY